MQDGTELQPFLTPKLFYQGRDANAKIRRDTNFDRM